MASKSTARKLAALPPQPTNEPFVQSPISIRVGSAGGVRRKYQWLEC